MSCDSIVFKCLNGTAGPTCPIPFHSTQFCVFQEGKAPVTLFTNNSNNSGLAYTQIMAGPCPISPEGPQPPANIQPRLSYCSPLTPFHLDQTILQNMSSQPGDPSCPKKTLVCRIPTKGRPFNSAECIACAGLSVYVWYDMHCGSLLKNCSSSISKCTDK